MGKKAGQKKPNTVQEYEYYPEGSILYGINDEYCLTQNEHFILYSFFVEYSMYGDQSMRRRNWIDYGWENNETIKNGAKDALCRVLNLYKDEHFVFTREEDLDTQFLMTDLADGPIQSKSTERGVFAIAGESANESYFLILFSRIRNCLAHGEFNLVYSETHEKMIVMQNHFDGNVKARCVLKLNTLLSMVRVVDMCGLIIRHQDS